MDTQLKAQSAQLEATLAEQRTRTLNERFSTAADKLGGDKPPAVRLAGVYAMAGLADDWKENRQTCVDVLCAYLRMPYEPDPGDQALGPDRLAFRANREVRHTVIRVITAHLQEEAAVSWEGLDFDFTGVVFDGGDFRFARFSGGQVDFRGAEFSGGTVSFVGAVLSGGQVNFGGAEFSGSTVHFGAVLSGSTVIFYQAKFSGGTVSFFQTEFSGGQVDFRGAEFSGGEVHFFGSVFSGAQVDFRFARFTGGSIYFGGAEFSGGTVSFVGARFSGGTVDFNSTEREFGFYAVRVGHAGFSGSVVDFSGVLDWSVPPEFPWTGTPPPGVTLPEKEDQSRA